MERVNEFLDLLERIVEGYNLDVTRSYNFDETGLTAVQKKPRRVRLMKGRSKMFSVSIGERGVNTTALCYVTATGCYVPPVLIYKRDRGCDDFKDGAPPGNVVTFNPNRSYIKKVCS
jgi:hypothetical protein